MSQENVERVRRSIDAWNRGDVDAWGVDAHPEIEYSSAIIRMAEGGQTAFRGEAEMRGYWDDWHSLWNLSVHITECRDLGDTVLALGHIHTRGKGSELELESPVAYVYEFEGGMFRTVRAYLDAGEALADLGLSE